MSVRTPAASAAVRVPIIVVRVLAICPRESVIGARVLVIRVRILIIGVRVLAVGARVLVIGVRVLVIGARVLVVGVRVLVVGARVVAVRGGVPLDRKVLPLRVLQLEVDLRRSSTQQRVGKEINNTKRSSPKSDNTFVASSLQRRAAAPLSGAARHAGETKTEGEEGRERA